MTPGDAAEERWPATEDGTAREARLHALLEELALEHDRTGEADVERRAREHPELAGELRALWNTVRLADLVGESAGEAETAVVSGRGAAHTGEDTGGGGLSPGDPVVRDAPARIGDHVLLEPIGRGGMGVVWEARHERLGRVVALKMLSRPDAASTEDLARFRAEAEAVARLDHPNIVQVHEVGETAGRPWFTMTRIEGESLEEQLGRGTVPLRRLVEELVPVCRAVAYAHERGVLHRDIKPSNILIDRDGRPVVTDFGLAKRLPADGSLTRTGTVLGTPAYMSPEQAGGRGPATPASDVWSLGAILYRILTGVTPFAAEAPLEVVRKVLEEEPPLPRSIVRGVDRDLEMVCLRCLQKPPSLRYASPADLADDLERWLASEPVAARSGSFLQVLGRLLRETPHAAVLENWGLLWMWHGAVLLVLCSVTHFLRREEVRAFPVYFALWGAGLGAWAAVFWTLRRRSGPVTFVERQVAHIWAGSVVSCVGLYGVELLLGLEPLTLSPVLGLIAGTVFLAKAGILSGRFYVQAAALYATAPVLALWPRGGLLVFGLVACLAFLVPGWRYHRQRRRGA